MSESAGCVTKGRAEEKHRCKSFLRRNNLHRLHFAHLLINPFAHLARFTLLGHSSNSSTLHAITCHVSS